MGTDQQTDKVSYRVALPQLKMKASLSQLTIEHIVRLLSLTDSKFLVVAFDADGRRRVVGDTSYVKSYVAPWRVLCARRTKTCASTWIPTSPTPSLRRRRSRRRRRRRTMTTTTKTTCILFFCCGISGLCFFLFFFCHFFVCFSSFLPSFLPPFLPSFLPSFLRMFKKIISFL